MIAEPKTIVLTWEGNGSKAHVLINSIVYYEKSVSDKYTCLYVVNGTNLRVKEYCAAITRMIEGTPLNDAQRDRLSRRMDVEQENNQYEEVSFDGASTIDRFATENEDPREHLDINDVENFNVDPNLLPDEGQTNGETLIARMGRLEDRLAQTTDRGEQRLLADALDSVREEISSRFEANGYDNPYHAFSATEIANRTETELRARMDILPSLVLAADTEEEEISLTEEIELIENELLRMAVNDDTPF